MKARAPREEFAEKVLNIRVDAINYSSSREDGALFQRSSGINISKRECYVITFVVLITLFSYSTSFSGVYRTGFCLLEKAKDPT